MLASLTSINCFLDSFINNELNGIRFLNILDENRQSKEIVLRSINELLPFVANSRWFTPNLFNIAHCGRIKKNVQFINVFVVDFDRYLPSPLDVLDLIEQSGLMLPHYLVRSNSPGHWHVYWLIDPLPAYSNIVNNVERITKCMADALGADIQAVGVERWFTVPRHDIYKCVPDSKKYTYQDFRDWYEVNTYYQNKTKKENIKNGRILKIDVFGHPAIKQLLQGVEKGKRDHACFTLALLFYAQNWTQEQAIDELITWNKKNSTPISQKQITKCVKSAFSGKYKGPKSEYIEYLTGIPFKLQIMRDYEGERSYQKLYDIKYRLIQLIRNKGTLSLSQTLIAKEIDAPLRSVKKAIRELIESKRIIKIGGGTGPGNFASYKLSNSIWKTLSKRKERNQQEKKPETNLDSHKMDRPVLPSIGANRITVLSTGPPG